MTDGRARFSASGQVTLDGSGGGTVRLAPTGENWEVDSYTVSVGYPAGVLPTLEAVCYVYQRFQTKTNIVDFTPAGSTGAVSDTVLYQADGEPLFFEWVSGDAGKIATVTIRGWRTLPKRGFRAN
jgi:hypothetical protein